MTPDNERLPRKAVRWLNRELAPRGLRICTKHQGHPLPLTEEYFFYRKRDGAFEATCKACRIARSIERKKERYASDADYRAQVSEWNRQYWERNPDKRREWSRINGQKYRLRVRAAQLNGVLERTLRP